jgi:DNA topoisomerase-1
MAQPREIDQRAGRRLSRPPRARLSRRLQPLARCCGASCRARARPAACNRWRCASSATANWRSRNSSRREYWSLVAHLATKDGAPFTARLVGADGKKIAAARHRHRQGGRSLQEALEGDLRRRLSRGQAREAPSLRRPSPPRPCSRRPRRKLGFAPAAPCSSPSVSMKASISAARPSASSPICEPTASTWRPKPSPARARRSARNSATRYVPESAAQIHRESQERAGSARGDPPDRPASRLPKMDVRQLDPDQARLYELIWTRTIASQMESAELERTTVDIDRPKPAAARWNCAPPARS